MESSTSSKVAIIVVVSIVIVISLIFISHTTLKQLRKRHSNPKYIPTQYLKTKWQAWHPKGKRSVEEGYSGPLHANASAPTLYTRNDNRSSRTSAYGLPDVERGQTTSEMETQGTATVDRNTSVRSVMTLPTYSRSVRDNERILGREGERDGVDVVIEQPETAEEEEERREEEMESLYQIRAQRRREITDRQQRADARREARARGDSDALRRLRLESTYRAEERETTGAAAMIREHREASRERRVSSVSYADLGVARHDGTRVRANSNESDRPLLDSAASISGNTLQPWLTQSTTSLHNRNGSTTSIGFGSDNGDSDLEPPPFGRAGSDYEVVTLNHDHTRTASRSHSPLTPRSRASSSGRPLPHSIETESTIPTVNPPAYDGDGFEEAPPYESPVREQISSSQTQTVETPSSSDAPTLPELDRLPSIQIAEPTPIDPPLNVSWPSSSRGNR